MSIALRHVDQYQNDRQPDAHPRLFGEGVEHFSIEADFRHAAIDGAVAADALPAELKGAAPIRRAHFLAGRHCAAEALRQLTPEGPTVVGRSQRGVPVWPAGIVGSITHTEGYAAAAVARSSAVRGLGIDSEGIISAEQARSVSTYVSWPSELAQAREAGLDRLQSLTLVFSAKESVFKCLYPLVGAMFYYHDVRIVGVDPSSRTFRARLVKTLSSEFCADAVLEGTFALSDLRLHTGMVLPR